MNTTMSIMGWRRMGSLRTATRRTATRLAQAQERLAKTLALPLVLSLACLVSLWAASAVRAEAGLENGGLRLRLSVNTTREGARDRHAVKLELLNVGQAAITLLAESGTETIRTYGDYVKSAVSFETVPEVRPGGAQVMYRKYAELRQEIAAGGSLVVDWEAPGPRLKPRDVYAVENTTPVFPGKGIYKVKVKLTVRTAQGKDLELTSNEEQVAVGGSREPPKWATAKVLARDLEKKTVRINVGAQQQIAKGDIFQMMIYPRVIWKMTVSDVGDGWAEGSVMTVSRMTTAMLATEFPDVGQVATLLPRRTAEEAVKEFGAAQLERDAAATYRKALARGSNEIWPQDWAGVIGELEPVRVYKHRVNIVVVLEWSDRREEGLYIVPLISSFRPSGPVDGFEFRKIAGDMYGFRKKS